MNLKFDKIGEGFEMGKVLGILIGVVGLVFIIAFARLFISGIAGQENRQAQDVLNSITEKIKNFEDGENGTIIIQGIEGWHLTGWSEEEEGRPDKCFFASCICISPKPNAESCQSEGLSRDFSQEKLEVFIKFIKVTKDVERNDFGQGNIVERDIISEEEEVINNIGLKDNLIELNVFKNETTLLVEGPSYVIVFDSANTGQ